MDAPVVIYSHIPLISNFIKFIAPEDFGGSPTDLARQIIFEVTLPDNTVIYEELTLLRTPVMLLHGKGGDDTH